MVGAERRVGEGGGGERRGRRSQRMTRAIRTLRWSIAFLALTAWVAAGCKRQPAVDELPVESEEEKSRPLPALTLTDETPDLLLTWIDDRGDAHLVHKIAEVAP